MLTKKQEDFTQYLFRGVEQNKAWGEAGYSTNYSMEVIAVNASRLANSTKVKLRLAELRGEIASVNIADYQERQEILTELARGNLLDYQETGADGGYLSIGKDSPNTRSIAEITSRTDERDSVITKVKLHSPTQAIDLLNKMDKVYSDAPAFNDNRVINFIVSKDQVKGIRRRLLESKSINDDTNDKEG